jgi:hypothetical protein
MASTDLTVRPLHTAPTLSAADRAAHDAASWLSPAGREALRRAETATAKIRDDEFTRALNQRGINEYNDYVASAAA